MLQSLTLYLVLLLFSSSSVQPLLPISLDIELCVLANGSKRSKTVDPGLSPSICFDNSRDVSAYNYVFDFIHVYIKCH